MCGEGREGRREGRREGEREGGREGGEERVCVTLQVPSTVGAFNWDNMKLINRTHLLPHPHLQDSCKKSQFHLCCSIL